MSGIIGDEGGVHTPANMALVETEPGAPWRSELSDGGGGSLVARYGAGGRVVGWWCRGVEGACWCGPKGTKRRVLLLGPGSAGRSFLSSRADHNDPQHWFGRLLATAMFHSHRRPRGLHGSHACPSPALGCPPVHDFTMGAVPCAAIAALRACNWHCYSHRRAGTRGRHHLAAHQAAVGRSDLCPQPGPAAIAMRSTHPIMT